jgi:hypothetical protein
MVSVFGARAVDGGGSSVDLGRVPGVLHPPLSVDLAKVEAPPRLVEDLADCVFYHSMEIPGHGDVDGQWDLRPNLDAYLGGVEFAGKRVLELGTADGSITFEIERQGAAVVSYDLSPDHRWDVVPYARPALSAARTGDPGHWLTTEDRFKQGITRVNNAYWLGHRAYESKARLVYGDVYSVPDEVGEVDVALFGAILLHTRDPFGALQSALRLTRETVVVTEMRDRLGVPPAISRMKNVLPRRLRQPTMRFLPNWRNGRDPDGWWRLSPELIVDFVGVLGFEDTTVSYHTQLYNGRPAKMFTVVGRRTAG